MAELPLALNPVLWTVGRLSEVQSCLNFAGAFFLQRTCDLEPSLCPPRIACPGSHVVGEENPFLKVGLGLLGTFQTHLPGSVLLTPLGAAPKKAAPLRMPWFIMMGQARFPGGLKSDPRWLQEIARTGEIGQVHSEKQYLKKLPALSCLS